MDWQKLQCQDVVLRALVRASHIDRANNRVLAAAFILRQHERELSVRYDCSAEQCAAEFNQCHGVATLHVGRVRNLGLDIIPDEPQHANIVGLPHPDDDPVKAEWFARRLQAQARLVRQKQK